MDEADENLHQQSLPNNYDYIQLPQGQYNINQPHTCIPTACPQSYSQAQNKYNWFGTQKLKVLPIEPIQHRY